MYTGKTAHKEKPHPNIILKDSNTTVQMQGQGVPEDMALLEKIEVNKQREGEPPLAPINRSLLTTGKSQ